MYKIKWFAVLIVTLVASLQANAATVTLSPANIQSFTQINATGSPVTIKTSDTVVGAGFTTVWGSSVNGVNSADVGATGLGSDWSGFDTFALNIANDNEHAWLFTVSVFDGTTTVTSAGQLLPNNSVESLFSVDITSLTLTAIDSVFVTLSGNLPINFIDRTAEYTINTVPVPAAAWLFGSALGLLGWLRRKSA
jgi:hypothetical protein